MYWKLRILTYYVSIRVTALLIPPSDLHVTAETHRYVLPYTLHRYLCISKALVVYLYGSHKRKHGVILALYNISFHREQLRL